MVHNIISGHIVVVIFLLGVLIRSKLNNDDNEGDNCSTNLERRNNSDGKYPLSLKTGLDKVI